MITHQAEAVPRTYAPPSPTAMHLESAMDAIERNDFQNALDSLNRAIVDAGMIDLAQCYALRGFVYLRLQNFRAAIDDCSESIRQRGEDAETLSWRAAAFGEQGDWQLAFADLIAARRMARDPAPYDKLLTGYSEPALETYRQRVKNGESSADLFCDRGQVYCTIGNFANAKRDYRLALEENPKSERALLGIAELELTDKNFSESEQLASKALMNATQFRDEALRIRAQAIALSGDLKRASKDIDLLREKSGDTAQGLVECAKLRETIGDLAGAVEDLSLAIQINHFHAHAFRMRGALYQRLHNFELAASDFTSYLNLVPNDDLVLLDRAMMNLKRHRLAEALMDFNAALERDDINADAYLGRSQVHLRLGDLKSADEDCQKAIRLDSRNADAFLTRGKILSAFSKVLKNTEQSSFQRPHAQLGEAEDCFTRALELEPDSTTQRAEIQYLRGVARYEQQKFFKASEDFKQATSLRPKHPGSFVWCAAVAAKLENWPEAIDNLQQAIMLRPSAANEYRTLGKPAAERAISYYDKLIERGDQKANSFESRGMAFQFLGRNDLAIHDYTVALKQNTDSYKTRIRRASLYLQNGNIDESIAELTKVIREGKDNHAALYQRAIARAQNNELDQATRDIEKAIELDMHQARYWLFRGDLLAKKQQISGAIASYDRAISIDPTDYVALNQRGSSWLRLGQPLRAISDLSQSLESYPRQPATVAQRGTAFMKNSQFELANEDFELALTHDQGLIKAYCGRALCLSHQNRFEEGLIWLTKQIQRFPRGRGLAEILMARGKIYYQMSRFAPAAADFSMVLSLERGNTLAEAAARCARAVALVQNGQLVRAEKEFRKVLEDVPEHEGARQAVDWLDHGEGSRPDILSPPDQIVRPTRPPVKSNSIKIERNGQPSETPPFDLWIVRTREKKEYGPVSRNMLETWISEGRIEIGAKLLRAGWPKWRNSVVVYPELVGRKPKIA